MPSTFESFTHKKKLKYTPEEIKWMVHAFEMTYQALKDQYPMFMTSRDLVDCGLFPSQAAISQAVKNKFITPPTVITPNSRRRVFSTIGVIEYLKKYGENRLYEGYENEDLV